MRLKAQWTEFETTIELELSICSANYSLKLEQLVSEDDGAVSFEFSDASYSPQ